MAKLVTLLKLPVINDRIRPRRTKRSAVARANLQSTQAAQAVAEARLAEQSRVIASDDTHASRWLDWLL